MLTEVDGKVKAGFDTPESAAAYQVVADMVKRQQASDATNERLPNYLAASWAWFAPPSVNVLTSKKALSSK